MWVRGKKRGKNKEKCVKQGNIPDMVVVCRREPSSSYLNGSCT
jgi:hypothetical protein